MKDDLFESLACRDITLTNPTPKQQALIDNGWQFYRRNDGVIGCYKERKTAPQDSNAAET